MKRLGSVFGIPVFAQPTFLVLVALYALRDGNSLGGLVSGLVAAGIVTVSILWHELGHAFAFRAFGERHPTIVLWGLGGLTYGQPPSRAWQSIVVSLAGPGLGLALGLASLAARVLVGGQLGRFAGILDQLVWINLAWTFFNLLPLHPLDGGSALRTLLVKTMGHRGLGVSLWISIATGLAAGALAIRSGSIFLIVLLAMLIVGNVSELRGTRGPLAPPAP